MINKIVQILKLPKVKITFYDEGNSNEIYDAYKYFNKRHKKYFIFKNKTIGVMLFKLFKKTDDYEKSISGKNGVGYFTRRCLKSGFYTSYFNQSEYLDSIYNINTSATERQGRKMSSKYLEPVIPEKPNKDVEYFGVFTKDNELVGYVRLLKSKNIDIITKILGHKDYLNDNIMYLLCHDLFSDLIIKNSNSDSEKWIMYDTFFGATPGLKLFKKRNCFLPYRVKWSYKNECKKNKK